MGAFTSFLLAAAAMASAATQVHQARKASKAQKEALQQQNQAQRQSEVLATREREIAAEERKRHKAQNVFNSEALLAGEQGAANSGASRTSLFKEAPLQAAQQANIGRHRLLGE